MKFSLIYARDEVGGIGLNGKIPWKCSEDLKRFKELTWGSTIIMGKRTFEEIGYLPNRITKVVSSQKGLNETLEECFGKIFVIGGARLFEEALKHPYIDIVYETIIEGVYNCDVFFDAKLQNPNFTKKGEKCVFNEYYLSQNSDNSGNFGELQYLDLIKRAYKGFKKGNTLSVFGNYMRFDLENSFPLLTTKKMFWKGVVEELLWFIRGETNSKTLEAKGVNIWKANAREDGELGPIYGYQWRNFGGDQLLKCIDMIKNQPNSRRIILSAWNCWDLEKMALPPCHILCQFYVEGEYLKGQLYQRSGDIGLGVPFNIASYSLLIYILAKICDLKPKEFLYCLGDAHIYDAHTELKEQLNRRPYPFPQLELPKKDIESYEFKDFKLLNYKFWPTINLPLIV